MLDGFPIIHAVVHPFDFSEPNFANEHGRFVSDLVTGGAIANSPAGYEIPEAAYLRDWSIEEIADMSFVEAYTDLAVYHVLPIKAFKDGGCGIDKALEARGAGPNRFLFYIGVDPMEGETALREMGEQYEALEGDVIGLKLYPNSWVTGDIQGWLMDDPEVAFPVFEKARDMGLRNVAVHKAIPLGPRSSSCTTASMTSTAQRWRSRAQFRDRPRRDGLPRGDRLAAQPLPERLREPGVDVDPGFPAPPGFGSTSWPPSCASRARRRSCCGARAASSHTRDRRSRLSATSSSATSLVESGDIAPITDVDKRDILAGNYARISGLDLDARLAAIEGDEFAQRRPDGAEPAEPWSTTRAAAFV